MLLLISMSAFFFFGCDIFAAPTEEDDDVDTTTFENAIYADTITATKTDAVWEYNPNYPIYKVDPSVLELTITNYAAANGKTLYLVKTNESESSTIPLDNTRIIKTEFSARSASNLLCHR